MHVATSPDTVMVVSQNSQLTTHGPSRTEIMQQPDQDKKGQATTLPDSGSPDFTGSVSAKTMISQAAPVSTPKAPFAGRKAKGGDRPEH